MKTIRIVLMLLGLYVSNMAYGVKLPEFHGFYAVDGGKLIEIREGENYDLSPTVEFISYHSGHNGIEKAVFVRDVHQGGSFGVRHENRWRLSGDKEIELRTKPTPGTTMTLGVPDMYYQIPRAPLTTGAYIIRGMHVTFFINKKESLLRQLECLDEYQSGLNSKYVPCANTPEPQSAGGAKTSQTPTSTAHPNTVTNAGTHTDASGKASGTQQTDAAKELSRFIESPPVSEEEEKRLMREEATRAARLSSSPDLMRLRQSRRDALKRNDYQGIIDPSLQILQIDPADYESLDYLANLYTAVNDPDKALAYAAECLKRVVRPRTFALITQAYLVKKDKKNTLLWLEKTLQSKYPHHPAEADLNQAFPKDQSEISRIFNKYRAASGASAASSGLAQNQPVPASTPVSASPEKAAVTGWKAVVSDGKLGEFGHGTKVSKTKRGELMLASSNNPMTHTHPGVDILAECGSTIYPVADGEVFDAINSKDDGDYGEDGKKGLGYMTIIKHDTPANTYSLYLHMQEAPSVKPGDKVIAGKTILGKIGKTGAAWGCHTHFEVRHFGTRYLTDKGWNYPANIYGKGEQADRLAKNWEDPLAIGAK